MSMIHIDWLEQGYCSLGTALIAWSAWEICSLHELLRLPPRWPSLWVSLCKAYYLHLYNILMTLHVLPGHVCMTVVCYLILDDAWDSIWLSWYKIIVVTRVVGGGLGTKHERKYKWCANPVILNPNPNPGTSNPNPAESKSTPFFLNPNSIPNFHVRIRSSRIRIQAPWIQIHLNPNPSPFFLNPNPIPTFHSKLAWVTLSIAVREARGLKGPEAPIFLAGDNISNAKQPPSSCRLLQSVSRTAETF